MTDDTDMDLVKAACDGAEGALEALIASHLPMTYSIVGKALGDAVDVDDVVQETMLCVVRGLPQLRDPAAFRPWMVAIAMNQIRKHHRRRRPQLWPPEAFDALADPSPDFTEVVAFELDLADQCKQAAQASAWLSDAERVLLSLWCRQQAGELRRSELVAALGLDPHAVSVRIARLKRQLDDARRVVKALIARPMCERLAAATERWCGEASPLWRKRIVRHVHDCDYCWTASEGQYPVQFLLVD